MDENKFTEKELRIIKEYQGELDRERMSKEEFKRKIENENRLRFASLVPYTDLLKDNGMILIRRRNWYEKCFIGMKTVLEFKYYQLTRQIYPLPEDKKLSVKIILGAYFDVKGNFIDFGTLSMRHNSVNTPHTTGTHICLGGIEAEIMKKMVDIRPIDVIKLKNILIELRTTLETINGGSLLSRSRLRLKGLSDLVRWVSREWHDELRRMQEHERRNRTRVCQNCDNEFSPSDSAANDATSFCCIECENEWEENRTLVCDECDEEYGAGQGYDENYCCSECRERAVNRKTCLNCSLEYEETEDSFEDYCCLSCKEEYEKEENVIRERAANRNAVWR